MDINTKFEIEYVKNQIEACIKLGVKFKNDLDFYKPNRTVSAMNTILREDKFNILHNTLNNEYIYWNALDLFTFKYEKPGAILILPYDNKYKIYFSLYQKIIDVNNEDLFYSAQTNLLDSMFMGLKKEIYYLNDQSFDEDLLVEPYGKFNIYNIDNTGINSNSRQIEKFNLGSKWSDYSSNNNSTKSLHTVSINNKLESKWSDYSSSNNSTKSLHTVSINNKSVTKVDNTITIKLSSTNLLVKISNYVSGKFKK